MRFTVRLRTTHLLDLYHVSISKVLGTKNERKFCWEVWGNPRVVFSSTFSRTFWRVFMKNKIISTLQQDVTSFWLCLCPALGLTPRSFQLIPDHWQSSPNHSTSLSPHFVNQLFCKVNLWTESIVSWSFSRKSNFSLTVASLLRKSNFQHDRWLEIMGKSLDVKFPKPKAGDPHPFNAVFLSPFSFIPQWPESSSEHKNYNQLGLSF